MSKLLHGIMVFLFCDLMQSDPAKMFYASFDARLVPKGMLSVEDGEDEG